MNILKYTFIVLAVIFVSCRKYEPVSPYVYETNPQYSWGFSEYFGPYYKESGNPNNVISLSLFSDSLGLNNDQELVGYGQLLFLENVFVNSTSTQLLMGTYTINDSGEPFTIEPGVLDTIDNKVYPLGAMISYYEENTAKSTSKMITEGSMEISRTLSGYTIICDFITDDQQVLKGSFTGELEYSNESATPQISRAQKKRTDFIH